MDDALKQATALLSDAVAEERTLMLSELRDTLARVKAEQARLKRDQRKIDAELPLVIEGQQ